MAPGIYTQIHFQFVFAAKFRTGLIQPKYKKLVYSFITELINSKGHKSYAVSRMPDHIHIFMSFNPKHSPAVTIKEIKHASSSIINDKLWLRGKLGFRNGNRTNNELWQIK